MEVGAENGNGTPHAKREEKKARVEKKTGSGRSIPANFTSIMSMVKWGGREAWGDKQEICPKKDILGFHQ